MSREHDEMESLSEGKKKEEKEEDEEKNGSDSGQCYR